MPKLALAVYQFDRRIRTGLNGASQPALCWTSRPKRTRPLLGWEGAADSRVVRRELKGSRPGREKRSHGRPHKPAGAQTPGRGQAPTRGVDTRTAASAPSPRSSRLN